MAFNGNVACSEVTWTLLTLSDVIGIRIQNQSSYHIFLQAAVGEVTPVTTGGALVLAPMETWAADLSVESLWPGISGANRIYAYVPNDCVLSVSHS